MNPRSLRMTFLLAALLAAAAVASPTQDIADFASTVPGPDEVAFVFLGYSGILVRTGDQVIAVDPANLLAEEDMPALKRAGLKLVLYTHGHGDHFHFPTALQLWKSTGAVLAAEPSVAGQLRGKVPAEGLITAEPGKTFTVGDISVDCVEGEHIGPIVLFRIRIGDMTLFHGGDSNAVPLSDYPSQVAFLPTGQPSPTASPEAAFRMASDLKPQAVVVFHGSEDQHAEFKEKMASGHPNVSVIVPEPGKTMTITLHK